LVKLGKSVVDSQGGIVENKPTPDLWNWSATLREAVSKIGKELHVENVVNSGPRSGAGPMTFFESILVCFRKYADFTGRASRPEFWWFALFITLVASALTYISQVLGEVFLIAVLLPFLAAGARRLRDSGKSAWWQLFLLAPVGGIVVVGFLWALPPISSQPDETTTA
jgi:hypothetical protein